MYTKMQKNFNYLNLTAMNRAVGSSRSSKRPILLNGFFSFQRYKRDEGKASLK